MSERVSDKLRGAGRTVKRRLWQTAPVWLALLTAWFIMQVWLVNGVAPSPSMEPTIRVGDRIIGDRLAYIFHAPERFDVIVFRFQEDTSQYYTKRIVGLPGETVEIRSGHVYIDGELIEEAASFVSGAVFGDFGPFEIPEDRYFVLGDNRGDSADSRYWDDRFVPRELILGKIRAVYWPLEHAAVVK